MIQLYLYIHTLAIAGGGEGSMAAAAGRRAGRSAQPFRPQRPWSGQRGAADMDRHNYKLST